MIVGIINNELISVRNTFTCACFDSQSALLYLDWDLALAGSRYFLIKDEPALIVAQALGILSVKEALDVHEQVQTKRM